MTTEIILIYGGLFALTWILFKLFRRQDNPFKKIWFWLTFMVSSGGLTCFFIYIFLRALGGPPPKEGWNREYFDDGQLQTEFFVQDGKTEGYYKAWYPNGQLKFYSKYKNGNYVDTSLIYYETGQIQMMEIFQDNKTVYKTNFYPNGQKESEYYNPISETENNFRIDYYANGTKKFETKISNSTFTGDGIYYFRNGKVQYKGEYKKGQKNGVWVKLDSVTGQILDTDTFDFNKPRPFKDTWD